MFSRTSFFLLATAVTAHAQSGKAPASAPAHEAAPLAPAQEPLLSPFTEHTLDGVLATINDEVLLLSELQKAVLVTSQGQTQLQPTGRLAGGPLAPEQGEQLLEQLIDSRILHLRVGEMGMGVSEEELDQEIAQFLKQQNILESRFEEMLRAEGETRTSHREEFRNQMEMQRFIGRVIRPQVTVTEDELRGFVLQQTGAAAGGKVRLKSLLIEMPSSLTEAQRQQKLQKVERVAKDISEGKDFETLVKLHSESSDAAKTGGALPPRAAKDLPQPLQERLAGAKPNDVIGPLTIGASVFFFQFLAQEAGSAETMNKAQLDQQREKLQEVKFQERLHETLRAERSKVRIVLRPFKFSK